MVVSLLIARIVSENFLRVKAATAFSAS